MKIWLFAGLQSLIALLGLTAFFLADNVLLASAAAVAAALLGIAQPLISAHKGRKLEIYQMQQWDQSTCAVDAEVKALLDEVIDPPLPHRPTVVVELQRRFGARAGDLIETYDRIADGLNDSVDGSQQITEAFAAEIEAWSLGPYLEGVAALQGGDIARAHDRFRLATEQQPGWVLPWLGWACAAYRQGLWEEIRSEHPHLCGVELNPYGAGDETTFLELTESDRDELVSGFQRAAVSLGNYYAIAEFCISRQQIDASREAYRKVA